MTTGPITRTRRGTPYRGDPCVDLVNAVAEAGRLVVAARRAGLPTKKLVADYHAARARAAACLGVPNTRSRWLEGEYEEEVLDKLREWWRRINRPTPPPPSPRPPSPSKPEYDPDVEGGWEKLPDTVRIKRPRRWPWS